MSHISHITSHKDILDLRWKLLRAVREFFWSQDFTEVETPLLLRVPGQEPYLDPMKVAVHDEMGETHDAYLHTSPEYTMKKMLAAGYTQIFSISKSFRDYESFGGMHNPEFTLIEWYRSEKDMWALMEDVENMMLYLQEKIEKWRKGAVPAGRQEMRGLFGLEIKKIHMRELWEEVVEIDLDSYLKKEQMLELCEERGYDVHENEPYEDLFYRIFLNEIEPKLQEMGVVMIHHYPAQMAALAKLSHEDPRYAERVEVYVNGIELANGFSELTDADEQLQRLKEEQALRKKLGKDVYDIDMEFIKAVGHMPDAAGIALGFDRLVQAMVGCKNINSLLPLPASELFNEQ